MGDQWLLCAQGTFGDQWDGGPGTFGDQWDGGQWELCNKGCIGRPMRRGINENRVEKIPVWD